MDESSILDVYKVAHCYDLVYMKVVLAHAISQWDADMVDTVLELCALVGHLETEEDQRGHEVIQAGSTYIAKHLALVKAKPTGLNALPYEAMLKVVQSEDITVPELDLFLILNQWIGDQLDITLRQAQLLYSHIRYGTIPYEFLSLGTSQDNLILTLQNHQQLSVGKTKDKLEQITPRLCQSEVLQVYPLVADLSMFRKVAKWEFVNVADPDNYTVGVIFSGRQEFSFQLSLKVAEESVVGVASVSSRSVNVDAKKVCMHLSSFCKMRNIGKAAAPMYLFETLNINDRNVPMSFMDYTITLKSIGAFLVQKGQTTQHGYVPQIRSVWHCKSYDLPFKGPFPWILRIAVPCEQYVSMTLYCE